MDSQKRECISRLSIYTVATCSATAAEGKATRRAGTWEEVGSDLYIK